MTRTRATLVAALFATTLVAADTPVAPKKPVTDEYHGVKVVDNYRWLEKADAPETKAWTAAQNKKARAYLDAQATLPALRKRLTTLMTPTAPGYSAIQKRDGTFFALKSDPKKDQPYLVALKSLDDTGSARVVVDPNTLDPKGKTTIDFFVPSRNGKRVAVSLSENGTEDGTVHLFDAESGKKLTDVIPRVNFPTAGGDLAWDADDKGFTYTRYPRGDERPRTDLNFYQQLYHHKLGTDTKEDTYVLGKDFPRIGEICLDASPDGNYLLATVQLGDGGEFMHYLRGPDGRWVQLTKFEDKVIAGGFGGPSKNMVYLLSRQDAPRGKIIGVDLPKPDVAKARTAVKERELNIEGLRFAANRLYPPLTPTSDGLYVVYSDGGPSRLRFVSDPKQPGIDVPLPTGASLLDIVDVGAGEALIEYETFLQPPAWYLFKPGDGKLRPTALAQKSAADFSDCEVVREFATSADGTKVPLSIVKRKDATLDGNNPTLLTGYGGFGISVKPRFKASARAWLEQGGILAVANLRGGSEYGEAWHQAGMLTKKQNVFDDFAACARHLIERKYTNIGRLAIEGGSNGGLLMGAALTQHPELYRAVVAHVGIYDMLRFEQHPNGSFNVTEYGSVKQPEQFAALYAYSPYHHVEDGRRYPAVFLLTGANDGRVDPANSKKMAARLQAASASKWPVLLLVDAGSGHGLGDGLSAAVAKTADVYAFLFDQLGVTYRPVEEPRTK